jgi:pyruvate,water dikinase
VNLPTLLHNWESIHQAGPHSVGGKGWQLARLIRYGLPVPDALVVPAEVEQQWLTGCQLPSGKEDPSDPAALDTLKRFHRQLLARALPQSFTQDLQRALSDKNWLRRRLAIRSSANAEDSQTASFAGIHLSRLNLVGLQAVVQAIREVWASRWTPQAVAYRQRVGLDQAALSMAVLIMPLLPTKSSGIAFTCDPRNGRDDRIILQAHWGLGEALVNGEAAGDEIILGEDPYDDSLRLVSYTEGDKAVMRLPIPGGTWSLQTPPERANTRVLNEHQTLKLGELIRVAALALDFSHPFFDLEWAWDGECFWLLQARPITVRGRNTYPALLHQPEIWSRGNSGEVTPYPLSVYDWYSFRRLINQMMERPLVHGGYPLQAGIQRAGLFDGRLYLNLSVMQWEFHDAFGLSPQTINGLIGGHQPVIRLPCSRLPQKFMRILRMVRLMVNSMWLRHRANKIVQSAHEKAKQWRRQPLADGEAALLNRLTEYVRQNRAMKSLFSLQTSSGASLSTLADMIEDRLPGEGHALAAALLVGGEPSVTARQAYDLSDLAKIAREDPLARQWIADPQRDNDWRRTLPEANPFRNAFADFLERYGHRAVYETYIRHPRWRENPGYLFDTIQGLMAQDMEALRRQQRQTAKQAADRIRLHLPFWLRPLLRRLIKVAREEASQREAARSAMISLLEPQRRILLRLGAIWRDHGLLQDPAMIFELTRQELQACIDGDLPHEGITYLLLDRQKQFQRWQTLSVPEVLLEQTGHQLEGVDEQPVQSTGEGWFQGMAVGTGRACGRARILRSPAEGSRLQPGEVLAAPSTDPSWTPLFLKASALIMESGGYLSHGAIVAREFGIPAVVNLPGVLDQLKQGEQVEVDGGLGRIRRLRNGEDD